MNRHLWFLLLTLPLGCNHPSTSETEESYPLNTAGHLVPFDVRLLEIAATYQSYRVVDLEVHLAVVDCRFVALPPRFSDGGDSATHGRKLYWLFARLPQPATGKTNPVGQVVVKEAWLAEEAKGRTRKREAMGFRSTDPITKDGREYQAGRKAGLFIMFKEDPVTPGTDEGWVYGTVTPDGKQVTSAGKVESCMGCHRKAPHDRLFGLKEQGIIWQQPDHP